MVERLLNELLKTTEAFQQVKNQNAVLEQESCLNAQAQLPLQHENERLVKENNTLHMQLIQRKEALEQVELRWKSTLRQAQSEATDLGFLNKQKDARIKDLESEVLRMKQKLEKVLSKLYMPGQDQIIGGMSSNGLPHNVIRGAQQTLEMNHGVNMDGVEGEEEQSNHNHGASQELRAREQEWANELRRADERSHEVRQRCEDLKKANSELEARCKAQEQQIETRDVEILRLGGLYQGGQNNDKLSMQYSQEQNQKIVGKLNAQLDFLNKENHRLQTQLDLFVKDKSVVEHIDKYRADIDDLTFENQTLRKDLRELTATLKDYQEADFHRQREARALADQQQASEREVDKQRQEAQ